MLEDLCDVGTEPGSPELQVDSLPSEPPGKPHHRSLGDFISVMGACDARSQPQIFPGRKEETKEHLDERERECEKLA